MGAVEDTCRLMMVLQTQLGGRLSPPSSDLSRMRAAQIVTVSRSENGDEMSMTSPQTRRQEEGV
ncbi:MAG: hypothetical protein GY826_05325 [Fuerstiella sp.]|nr:hypothetical protein [Fuerstiella sp.]